MVRRPSLDPLGDKTLVIQRKRRYNGEVAGGVAGWRTCLSHVREHVPGTV
jgi:hypothetical protein